MNAAEKLEIVCAKAWPALVEEPLGEWVLRWADGFTGRANSALAIGDPGRPVGDALRAVCDFAHARDIPPAVQVVENSRLEHAVAAEGWRERSEHAAGHRVVVLTGPLPSGPAPDAEVLDQPTPEWWELAEGTAAPGPAQRHVVTTGKVGYGVVRADGRTAGAVRGALVDGWLHVGRLAVAPGFRRRGLATTALGALAEWGRAHGAEQWILQVAAGNTGALALYSGLGCSEHHRYRYWGPAPGTCEDREP